VSVTPFCQKQNPDFLTKSRKLITFPNGIWVQDSLACRLDRRHLAVAGGIAGWTTGKLAGKK